MNHNLYFGKENNCPTSNVTWGMLANAVKSCCKCPRSLLVSTQLVDIHNACMSLIGFVEWYCYLYKSKALDADRSVTEQ